MLTLKAVWRGGRPDREGRAETRGQKGGAGTGIHHSVLVSSAASLHPERAFQYANLIMPPSDTLSVTCVCSREESPERLLWTLCDFSSPLLLPITTLPASLGLRLS